MSSASKQLGERAKSLQEAGADPLRIELLRRARQFKRSWVDMAEALVELRVARSYLEWGYKDFYDYADQELLLKRRTVEKLTGSFTTLQSHAPTLLSTPDRELPTYDAVDYYARAVGDHRYEREAKPHAPEVMDELKSAIFEEVKPLSVVRKQFNDVLYAKSKEQIDLEQMTRACSAAQRLCKLLPDIDGVSTARSSAVIQALDGLVRDLEVLIAPARERLAADQKAS